MKIFPIMISGFLVAALLVSCKSVDATSTASTVAQKTEKPVPRIVEIKTWKIESTRVSYPDGIVSAVSSIKYDDAGLILLEEQYDGKNNLVSKKAYTWDPGKSASIITTNAAGEIIGKAVCLYSGDLPMSETLSNASGDVQSTEDYKYDASGNRTGLTVKTATGGMVSTEYVRENGNIVRINILDASGNAIKHYERTYGTNKGPDKEVEYDSDGNLKSTITYIYDGGFLSREENLNATGAVQSRIEYVNDANGNPIEVRYLDRAGHLIDVKKQQWKLFTRTVSEE